VHQTPGGAPAAPTSNPEFTAAAAERCIGSTHRRRTASVKHILILQWFKDVSIAKKLYFTVSIMALLIGAELFALYFSLNTLSAVRAYVGGEGLWSKAQKDAVLHLYKYGVSGDHEDYLLFRAFMQVPLGDGKARQELQSTSPDMERARQGFLEGRNHPDDIAGMIWLFKNFSDVPYIEKAIGIWSEAEPIAMQLIPISKNLREEINSSFPSQGKNKKTSQLDRSDKSKTNRIGR
jgi:hypothetical protein